MTTEEEFRHKWQNQPQQAFPSTFITSGNSTYVASGLSKREWFAGMALQGLCAYHGIGAGVDRISESAISQADGLIERLKQP